MIDKLGTACLWLAGLSVPCFIFGYSRLGFILLGICGIFFLLILGFFVFGTFLASKFLKHIPHR